MRRKSGLWAISRGKSAGRQSVTKHFAFVFAVLLALALSSYGASALKQLVSTQGKITLNGALVDDGNISITIWDSATGGALVYNSSNYFNDTIQNGYFDVMLGSEQDLNLNLSGTYYMDFQVNDVDLDKGGTERLQFQSPVGYKVSGTDNFTVDTNTLFVDTTNKRVGINTTSPTATLDVNGTFRANNGVRVLRRVTAQQSAVTCATTGTNLTGSSFNVSGGLLSTNKGLRITASVQSAATGAADSLVYNITFGGAEIFAQGGSTTRGYTPIRMIIYNRDSASSQISLLQQVANFAGGDGIFINYDVAATKTSSVNTAVDQTIAIRCQDANSGVGGDDDTARLEFLTIEEMGSD